MLKPYITPREEEEMHQMPRADIFDLFFYYMGGKKMASEVRLERNSCSNSGVVSKEASSTCGDMAFHTDVLPAR
jgi:hypothetical protein